MPIRIVPKKKKKYERTPQSRDKMQPPKAMTKDTTTSNPMTKMGGGMMDKYRKGGEAKKKKKYERQGMEYDKPVKEGQFNLGNKPKVIEVKSGGLTGGQRKLDVNRDGKISGEDFKILRGKENKMRGGGIAIKGTNFKGVF